MGLKVKNAASNLDRVNQLRSELLKTCLCHYFKLGLKDSGVAFLMAKYARWIRLYSF